MTSSEGSRPSIETVSVKEVITNLRWTSTGTVSWRLPVPGSLTRPGTAFRSEPLWLLRGRAPAEVWTSRAPSLTF